MTQLSDRINKALDQRGWGGRSVRELAAETDGAMSKDTIAIYRRGDHGVPDEVTLRAWSALLDIPIDELRAAAGVAVGELGAWEPPAEAVRMNRRQRDAVTELIRSMVAVDRDATAERRRALITGYLQDPSTDPDLVTRLADIGYKDVTKRPRRGTAAATIWESRRNVLLQELDSLPPADPS